MVIFICIDGINNFSIFLASIDSKHAVNVKYSDHKLFTLISENYFDTSKDIFEGRDWLFAASLRREYENKN